MRADLGYKSYAFERAVRERWGARVEIKKHAWQGSQSLWLPEGVEPPPAVTKPKGFVVLPDRWVVERTFGWIGRHRRHSRDYETLPEQSEFFIRVSMTRNMLRRLTKPAS